MGSNDIGSGNIEMACLEPPNLLARIQAALPLILELDYSSLLCLASELTLDARFPSQAFMDPLKQEQCVDREYWVAKSQSWSC
jgi:hypothetical protein